MSKSWLQCAIVLCARRHDIRAEMHLSYDFVDDYVSGAGALTRAEMYYNSVLDCHTLARRSAQERAR